MSRIYISKANPIRFVWENRTKPTAYNNYTHDNSFFQELIYDWEEPVYYEQKWQTTDFIRLQFLSDFTGIELRLTNADTGEYIATTMSQKQQDANNPGFRIYECDISLTSVPPGNYYLKAILGTTGDTLKSEPLCIQDKHEGTVFIEYYHRRRKADLIFEKGFRPAIRIEARFGKTEYSSKDSIYEDQPLNMTLIDSKQFSVYTVVFGNEWGIPAYMVEKLNLIHGFDNVRYNGKQFCKAEAGQEFEETAIEGYPMSGYRYKLRESLNRASNVIDTTENTERKIIIMATAQTDIFGDMEFASNDQILIKNYD